MQRNKKEGSRLRTDIILGIALSLALATLLESCGTTRKNEPYPYMYRYRPLIVSEQ